MTTITFEGGLVSSVELRKTSNDKSYAFFTVAREYRENKNNEWVTIGTAYVRCTVWGHQAESLANSNVPKGTRLLITGRLSGTVNSAYVNKNGEEIPERFEETVSVQNIGVSLGYSKLVTVSKAEKGEQSAPLFNTPPAEKKTAPVKTTKAKPVAEDDFLADYDETDDTDFMDSLTSSEDTGWDDDAW